VADKNGFQEVLDAVEQLNLLPAAIINVSKAVQNLNESRLSRRALVVLIQDSVGGPQRISKGNIEDVLNHMSKLADTYLTHKRKHVFGCPKDGDERKSACKTCDKAMKENGLV
jgi:hypothetical protein